MGYWDSIGKSDEWYTPPHVFEALDCRFDLDVAAPKDVTTFVPARAFLTDNSLAARWNGFVWMNPPFGGRNGIKPWLDKFFEHGNGIALTPDRTSAPWFRDAWGHSDAVLFTPKIKFLRPDGSEGKSPSNGTALFASGERGVDALIGRQRWVSAYSPIRRGRTRTHCLDLLSHASRSPHLFGLFGNGESQ